MSPLEPGPSRLIEGEHVGVAAVEEPGLIWEVGESEIALEDAVRRCWEHAWPQGVGGNLRPCWARSMGQTRVAQGPALCSQFSRDRGYSSWLCVLSMVCPRSPPRRRDSVIWSLTLERSLPSDGRFCFL